MKVRLTLVEEMLGTSCSNPEVHEEFIASKSADKVKIKEELEALPAEVLIEKSLTIFPRDENGNPFLYDYQIRGFLKNFLGTKVEFGPLVLKVGKKDYKFSKWTYKRLVDNYVFVKPRRIKLNMPEGSEVSFCTRPLRAETMKGERVALATSEAVPAGTTFEFEIRCLQPELYDLMPEALDYGEFNGLLQWRNSGKGTFTWEDLDEQKVEESKKSA